jgi:hypothetical protein
MASIKGFKKVGYIDVKGGGQVVFDRGYAYVGHIFGPEATTVVDVRDPKNPKLKETIDLPWKNGAHSHKVRVKNGIMVTNVEKVSYGENKPPPDFVGGLNIYTVDEAGKPVHVKKWECAGKGVHRYTFDGRYAYISPCVEGFRDNIVMILDLKDPKNPVEVGRWWMKGQWKAGGETPTWKEDGNLIPHCHHPIRKGNILYTSYWHGGFVILDISDMSKPKQLSGMDWSGAYGWPSHTCLPLPNKIEGRDFMLHADECAVPRWNDADPSFAMLRMVDVTDPTNPICVSSFRVPSEHSGVQTCHQPAEDVMGNEIPVAWFNYGLRMVDVSDPFDMKEVAHYEYDPPEGFKAPKANDVCWDDRGLIYVIDRSKGLHIVERTH